MKYTATALAMTCAMLSAPVAQAQDSALFRTPSGNIHCIMSIGSEVDCEIHSMTRLTLRLQKPADCDLDWGGRFAIGVSGRPYMVCHGDTVQDPSSRVLGYGKTLGGGGLNCISEKSGLTCKNSAGHGFKLSRARQRFF